MKKSFTMAEVLITLGIIGIIAAMTLPALINKYDLYVRQQQFKKAYATLSNALQRADFELGGYTRCHYPENSNLGFQNEDCSLLHSTLTSYFNKLKKCEGNALAGGCLPPDSYKSPESIFAANNPDMDEDETKDKYVRNCNGLSQNYLENISNAYLLNNGLLVIEYGDGQTPIITADINGHKGPNKWGYDVFSFIIRKKTSGLSLQGMETGSCQPVEKGGYSARSFIDLMNR